MTPIACHYDIQLHVNWPTEKGNVRWKFHLSIGSNGQTIFQWTFPGHYVIQIHVNWWTKKQMSDGNSTCPLHPMDKQNSNGHFQVHSIQWIHWTLSFGHLNGIVSTCCPYAYHYVIQIYVNWPTEKANVRWKFHLPIGPNGQTKFQWTFPGPLDPMDPLDMHFRLAISMA
jgi:hypothetical protein